MAKCGVTNIGGGGGISSNELSAIKKYVVKDKTYVGADTNDEIGVGELDLDAVTAMAPDVLSGKVIVDKDGKPLTGTMPNRGTVNQSLGINGTYTIPAGYHNGSGKVTQNIPIQGADVSGTDRAWATNMSNWEGTVNLGVRNGYYLNGVNWIQGSLPNYSARNIRAGVNMGGVVGTMTDYSYLAAGQTSF